MSDLIDVPDEAAILAAQVMAGVDPYRDVGTAWVECARRALLAALPVLRAQIEAEIRTKIGDEIEVLPTGTGGSCHVAVSFFRTNAARLARGGTNG